MKYIHVNMHYIQSKHDLVIVILMLTRTTLLKNPKFKNTNKKLINR